MKKTKMLMMLLMIAVFVLGIGGAVMAEEADKNELTVDISKVYQLLNASESVSVPEETFTFKIEKDKAENSSWTTSEMPDLLYEGTDGNLSYTKGIGVLTFKYDARSVGTTQGVTKTAELQFPVDDNTRVGEYTYKITETAGTTAGLAYDDKTIFAKVTVVNDDDDNGVHISSITYTIEDGKLDEEGFVNKYQAGEININKTVTGNFGDKNKYFEVTIKLVSETGMITPASFTVSGGSYKDNPTFIEPNVETEFYLKHDETIMIKDVPYGMSYTVAEADYAGDGYDSAKYTLNGTGRGTESVNGEKVDSAEESVIITNNKGTNVDTGVVLDNLPYIVLLVIVIAAAAVWFLRRRTAADRD